MFKVLKEKRKIKTSYQTEILTLVKLSFRYKGEKRLEKEQTKLNIRINNKDKRRNKWKV